MVRPFACLILLSALAAAPALARPPPPPMGAGEPWPAPDPKSWWDDLRPRPAEAADPLAGRRGGRTPALGLIGAPEPLLYRLWGLPALQHQVLRPGEVILEVWVRPSLSVRQTVARVVVRQDGKAFVEARAGLACCTPEIGRRVGFDAELPAASAERLARLKDDPLWLAPRDVRVVEGGGASDAICVDGASYDLMLVTTDRARLARRACDAAEVGQAAEVLEAVLGAALGQEPRIDTIFPGGASYALDRAAYRQLIAGGGALEPARNGRALPAPRPEDTPPVGAADVVPRTP
jgi:hypothetical protein